MIGRCVPGSAYSRSNSSSASVVICNPHVQSRQSRRGSSSGALERELLHPPSGRCLADVEVALTVDAHPVRAEHLPDLPSPSTEFADNLEI
jgi:hypothetical protein